jgi:protein-S-isoprenylcysteine O-methyltransferase Ste14
MHRAQIWQLLLYGWTLSEFLLVLATRTRKKSGAAIQDHGSIRVLWAAIFCSVFLAMWGGLTAGFHPDSPFGRALPLGHTARSLAIPLMVFGLAVRWIAIWQLGRAFSVNVAIRREQKLQTSGLYRFARHPSYTGMLIIFTAVGLAAGNWLSLAIVVLFPTAALLYRIRVEERVLRGAFGEQYIAYSARVKRLIPGVY